MIGFFGAYPLPGWGGFQGCVFSIEDETTILLLGGGFKHFLFLPLFGKKNILTNIFQRG